MPGNHCTVLPWYAVLSGAGVCHTCRILRCTVHLVSQCKLWLAFVPVTLMEAEAWLAIAALG